MPQYKVISPGFYAGRLYDPQGKRPVLHTDLPFSEKNPMPPWLAEMPKETEAEKKKRKAQEKTQKDANATKAKQDKADIANASTAGDGQDASFLDKVKSTISGKSSNVETI